MSPSTSMEYEMLRNTKGIYKLYRAAKILQQKTTIKNKYPLSQVFI